MRTIFTQTYQSAAFAVKFGKQLTKGRTRLGLWTV
jgi:hypothetical protein